MEPINTPYFIIRTEKIENELRAMQKALSKVSSSYLIGYSVKTNNLPWLVGFMREKGVMAEVVSSDEYDLAKELEYEPRNIIFNGPVKGKHEFIEAVENGAIVNIDSNRELNWLLECDKSSLKKSKLGLRVNFCIEDYCSGESQCGSEDGRFGFSYETGDLKRAVDFMQSRQIPLCGLHLHCSSKTRSLGIYGAISKAAAQIAEEYKLKLDYVDIGGGFFGGMPDKPTYEEYFQLVKSHLNTSAYTQNATLIIEPGMALVGANIDYIASCVDIKRTKNNLFVITDGSRIHIDPLMRKGSYQYHFLQKNETKEWGKMIISGFTCMENDRFFALEGELLSEGAVICFEKVGAYTMGLSPQFISFYPEVYAEIEGKPVLVRKKHTAKDFVGG